MTEYPGQEEERSWRKCSCLKNFLPASSLPWKWAPCPQVLPRPITGLFKVPVLGRAALCHKE